MQNKIIQKITNEIIQPCLKENEIIKELVITRKSIFFLLNDQVVYIPYYLAFYKFWSAYMQSNIFFTQAEKSFFLTL